MAGWVYIFSNPSMPDLLKIGYTEKDPKSRAKEISQDTGVPSEFVVDYQVYSSRPRDLEQKTHSVLSKYRINNNREFFNCSHEIAIEAIKQAISILGLNNDPSTGLEIYHKLDRQKIEIELEKNKKHRELEYLLSKQENLRHNLTLLKEINSELSSESKLYRDENLKIRKEINILKEKIEIELEKNKKHRELEYLLSKQENLRHNLTLLKEINSELSSESKLYRDENLKIRKEINILKENYLSNLGTFKIKLEGQKEILKNELKIVNNQLTYQSNLNHNSRNELNVLIEKYNELKQKLEIKKKNKELNKRISELENQKNTHIRVEKEKYEKLEREDKNKMRLRFFLLPFAAGVFGSLSSVLPIAILNLGSESNLIMLILCTIIVFIWGIRNNIRNHQQYVDYIKREFTQKTNSLEQEYNIQRKYLENQIIKET